jgi:hypothetical protein
MARASINIDFNGSVTFAKNGQTFSFTGDNVYEGFENVKSSHNGHSNHGHDVIHLTEVEATGGETNLLHHPVTLTGSAATDLIATLSKGTAVSSDSDNHGHSG